ncbi:MAG: hypothetical protein VB111_01670 [Clostridiaceae bacterium]|nr:hypothetical protein [Clostridiaceae bacterium]
MHNRIQTAFDKVHAEDSLKKSTKDFISNRTQNYGKKTVYQTKRLITAFACIVFVLFGIVGSASYFTPVSAISIDVNPSVELGVNRFDKVVSVESYNEDGRTLAASMDIKYMNYADALNMLMTSESIEYYLANDEFVSITVLGATDEKSEEMLASISSSEAVKHTNISCDSGNYNEVEAAHEAGLSFGKYDAFLELQALDPSITIEDVQELTMRQIKDRIDDLSEETHNSSQGNGNGKGNGSSASGNGHGGH